ncbi:MAG: response regulator [Deltaproteobacteria bacterium]|nr:response regulator [Deltaproteobacteria bacterium]
MADIKKSSKRLLVVDDEQSMRELLAEYLKEFGYEVVCAENGQEALKLYKMTPFDIVISDLIMSPVDGMELLGEITKFDPDAVFIMITGHPSIESALQAIKKGAKDYISKPFNIDEINLKIARVLLEKSLQGRLKNIQGIVWALIISIPVWLILGIILARMLK